MSIKRTLGFTLNKGICPTNTKIILIYFYQYMFAFKNLLMGSYEKAFVKRLNNLMFKIFHFSVLLLFALSFFRLPSLAHDVVRPGHRYLKDEVFFMVGNLLQAHGRGRRTGHKVNYLFLNCFIAFQYLTIYLS